jgi:histidyl-tRNA synthetase
MRQADAADVLYAAILGKEELATSTVILRRMEDGHQERVPTKDVRRLIAKTLRQAR